MFTGIVTGVGVVTRVLRDAGGLGLEIEAPFPDLALGESVSVDGACLTVERWESGHFSVHVVETSLERTNLGGYVSGRRVNLERALRAADRLGGHLVQGHVDGVGTILRTAAHGDAWVVDIQVPTAVWAVSVPLGSVAVDGVSLTVNGMPEPDVIQVSLIPFTLQHTTLGERGPGDTVQLEADPLGKYVRRFLDAHLEGLKG